jgi:hypothetical protein
MRASQICWYLQKDDAPTVQECLHHYTHIDAVSQYGRAELNKLRRSIRRQSDAYRETEQGDVQLPDA